MYEIMKNTLWKKYREFGKDIWVKREDLCCPYPGPMFSKIRGVDIYLSEIKEKNKNAMIGVLDTIHSKAGWGTAFVCNELNLRCINFYPVYKGEKNLRYNQSMSKKLKAELYPLKAGMSAVLFNMAKKILREQYINSVMMPNALKLKETMNATFNEVYNYTPKELIKGTWVISASSGTIAAGVLRGLSQLKFKGKVICHMGFSRNHEKMEKDMKQNAGEYVPFSLIDEGYQYKEGIKNDWIPFPCNSHYDAKAFLWLITNIDKIDEPICFWNIGA